ncbi:MAG: hypothetical protein ACOCYT_00140 [Chloroflexota bacterium]
MMIFSGQWTAADYMAAAFQAGRMIRTVDHSVDVIANMTTSIYPPPGIMVAVARMHLRAPENVRMIVIVGPELYATMAQGINRLVRTGTPRVAYAPSMDAAMHLLGMRN